MNRLLLFLFFVSYSVVTAAQSSDFISIKKRNSITIKSFYSGSPITLLTKDGMYINGAVQNVVNDSLFILWYDVRITPTVWGNRQIDTIAAYVSKVHYSAIKWIDLNMTKNWIPRRIGKSLAVAGAGGILLNGFNAVRNKEALFSKQNTGRYIISAILIGAGVLINRFFWSGKYDSKRHRVVYVRLDTK